MVVVAGEPEELHVEVLLKEDCAAAVDPGVGRGGVKAGSDDSIRDPPVVRASFMILPIKIGRGRRWGWAWSERFENRNKRNAFLRFILQEHGFKLVESLLQCLKCVFRHFVCIKNRPKNGRGRSQCFPMEWFQ